MMRDMNSGNITMRKAGDKAPNRPAPPVPAARSSKSSTNVERAESRPEGSVKSNKSETEIASAKMNEEILQYRLKLREKQKQPIKSEQNPDNVDNSVSAPETLESLREKLQDVTEKNAQWQVYDNQREEYVKNLIGRFNDLHHQFHHLRESYSALANNPDQLSEQQRRYFDSLLVQARQELETSRNETSNLKSQLNDIKISSTEGLKQAQEEIDFWRAKYEQKKEVIGMLRKEIKESGRRKHMSNNADKENVDRINLLQHEMETYKKDFCSERRKRENLEKRLDTLQRKLKDTKISPHKVTDHDRPSDHDKLNPDPSHEIDNCSASPPKIKKALYTGPNSHRSSHKERRSHPVKSSRDSSRPHRNPGSHLSEGRGLKASDRMNKTYSEFGHHFTDEDSQLRCPNCGKAYGVDEHEFLLIHIDSCI